MLGIDPPIDGVIIKGKYAEKIRYELRKARDPNFVPDPKFEDFPNNYDGPDDKKDKIIYIKEGTTKEEILKMIEGLKDDDQVIVIKNK